MNNRICEIFYAMAAIVNQQFLIENMNKYNKIQDLIYLIAKMDQSVEQLVDLCSSQNWQYRYGDIAIAVYVAFFVQLLSFLSNQRRMAHDNDGNSCVGWFGFRSTTTFARAWTDFAGSFKRA